MVVLKLDTTILLTTTALMLLWNYGLVVCTNCDNLLDIFRNLDETFYIDLVKINSSYYRLFSSTFVRSVYYFIKLVFYFKTNHAGQKKEQIQCIVENPIHTQSGDLKRHIKTIHEGGRYWKQNVFFWKFLYSIRILGDAQTWFLCKKLYVLLQDIWTYTSGQLKRSKQLEMWFLWKILHYFWMYVKNLNNIIDDEQKYYINYVSV